MSLLAQAVLALTLPTLASPPVAPPAPPQELSASDLQKEIDRSLRWLRGQVDLEAGTYGNLTADAWVLLAFATSPRRYREGDGPFLSRPLTNLLAHQRADGGFGDHETSRVVLASLEALNAGRSASAQAKLRQHLRNAGEERALANPVAALPENDVVPLALRVLGSKGDLPHWGPSRPSSRTERSEATARNLVTLNRAHARLVAGAKATGGGAKQAKPLPALSPADRSRVQKALARGAAFLHEKALGEGDRWGFDGRADPGITSMVLGALLASPGTDKDERGAIDASLDWLVEHQKEDGSIHAGGLANYVTSVAILALRRAGRPQDERVIQNARRFLVGLQADEGEGYESGDRYYGGVGYGGDERPDLSNLQMAMEALAASGTQPGDETFEKAIRFLQRCQNRSESNDLALTQDGKTYVSGNDGGSGYAPGESKAGFIELPDGKRVPRSYGSMTYALLKGYLFAGLDRDDPRVEAAWTWLKENYTLDVNPGFQASSDPTAAYQGLFYYFYTMAQALELYGEEEIEDAAGDRHVWRTELAGRILAMQRQDGSWINENAARWYEGNPILATSYAMLTLATTLGSAQ